MADINKAKKKMDKVILDWFTSDPLMMSVWCMVNKQPDKEQKTIGIDARSTPPVIKYNPNFINSLNFEQLEAVMASEGFKLLLRHCTSRFKKPKNISNLSSSIAINQLLMGNILNMQDMKDFFPSADLFGLEKDKFYEEYFRKLLERVEDVEDQIKEIWNSMSKEEKQKAIENAINSSAGRSEDSGSDDNKDDDGFQKMDGGNNGNDSLKEYFDPNGTSNDEWSTNESIDADIKNMIKDKKSSAQSWGKFTSKHMADIVAANTPKISYKEILRRFETSILSGNTVASRMKVNRRYDLQNPGYRRIYQPEVILAVDQSGSMTDNDLSEGFSVVNNILSHAKITVVMFDTEINDIINDIKKAKKVFKRTACGGTDFQCVIDYANKNKSDGLIIFTDGVSYAPTKPKNTKVLWLLTDKNNKPPVNWGMKAYLDKYEKN